MALYSTNLKNVKEHLDDSENITFSCFGAFETKRFGKYSIRNGVFVATEKRIVFYAKKMFGFELESFPIQNISSIEMSKGLWGKKIKFMMSGNTASMKLINQGEPENLVNYVRDIMSSSNLETKGDILNDIPIQIKKLSNLRDEGIISDEEFSTKKTELLSRI